MPKRILILSASIGLGHVRAAQALHQAFSVFDHQVVSQDALELIAVPWGKFYGKAYNNLVDKAPEVLGWLYEHAAEIGKYQEHGHGLHYIQNGSLIRFIKTYNPDVVITTHPLLTNLVSLLLCQHSIAAKHVVVVTDFDVHSLWMCHHYCRYFVATVESREHLIRLGIERKRVIISGIPIDSVFLQCKDKLAMRTKHQLDPDRLTLLLSAGGFGLLPVEEVIDGLSGIKCKFQLIAVCGHNRQMQMRLEEISRDKNRLGLGSIKVIGFTEQIDELMTASDLVLGKPGGLTVAEALSKGLVFVIVNPIPGQEERNASYLLEEGAAIRCNNLPTLSYKVNALISNPARWQAMQSKSVNLARPLAARTIAHHVDGLLQGMFSSALYPPDHRCPPVLNSLLAR